MIGAFSALNPFNATQNREGSIPMLTLVTFFSRLWR